MPPVPIQPMTEEEYLAFERASFSKHEYHKGQIYAMAGASKEHNAICMNLARHLGNALGDGPCQPFGIDLRTKVESETLYTYPDFILVCGEPVFQDDHFDTLLNPKVIFEVLSPSTETYDRGRKFAMYMALESLSDYILIAQQQMRIEHYVRSGKDEWHLTIHTAPDSIVNIESAGCQIKVEDVYARVQFPPPEKPRTIMDPAGGPRPILEARPDSDS